MPLIPDVGIRGKIFGYRGWLCRVVARAFAFDGKRHACCSCVVGAWWKIFFLINRQLSNGNMWVITALVKLYVYW